MKLWDSGHGTPCDQGLPVIPAWAAVHIWNGVSDYIVEQLVLSKDVRIIRLGTFLVKEQVVDGKNGLLTVHRPVFCLARNLAEHHGLTHDKTCAPGHKQAEPLRYAHLTMDISFSWQIVEACIEETMYLLSCCVESGKNVALVLKGVGMLVIEGSVVSMRFYKSLLQRLNESDLLVEALLGMPEMRDSVLSGTETAASLTFSGSVIVFPSSELEICPRKPLVRRPPSVRPPPGRDSSPRLQDVTLPPGVKLSWEEESEESISGAGEEKHFARFQLLWERPSPIYLVLRNKAEQEEKDEELERRDSVIPAMPGLSTEAESQDSRRQSFETKASSAGSEEVPEMKDSLPSGTETAASRTFSASVIPMKERKSSWKFGMKSTMLGAKSPLEEDGAVDSLSSEREGLRAERLRLWEKHLPPIGRAMNVGEGKDKGKERRGSVIPAVSAVPDVEAKGSRKHLRKTRRSIAGPITGGDQGSDEMSETKDSVLSGTEAATSRSPGSVIPVSELEMSSMESSMRTPPWSALNPIWEEERGEEDPSVKKRDVRAIRLLQRVKRQPIEFNTIDIVAEFEKRFGRKELHGSVIPAIPGVSNNVESQGSRMLSLETGPSAAGSEQVHRRTKIQSRVPKDSAKMTVEKSPEEKPSIQEVVKYPLGEDKDVTVNIYFSCIEDEMKRQAEQLETPQKGPGKKGNVRRHKKKKKTEASTQEASLS